MLADHGVCGRVQKPCDRGSGKLISLVAIRRVLTAAITVLASDVPYHK